MRSSRWDMALVSWIPLLTLGLFAALFFSAVPRSLPLAVVDHSNSPTSRELVRALQAAPALDVRAQPTQLEQAWSLLRAMEVYALVYIPGDTEQQLQRGQKATLFAFYNATFTTAGATSFRDIDAAVKQTSAQFMLAERAKVLGTGAIHAAPVNVQVSILYNSARNFEVFLLGLLFPAVLHLMLCMLCASALGRELRDKSAGSWLQQVGGHVAGAILGKLLPYIALFSLYGLAGLLWVSNIRGDGMAGSLLLLSLGLVLMFAAYGAVALLIVGATRNMGSSLSLIGLYAGTSIAFCGATFPIDGASLLARTWSQLLPFTYYTHLDAAERYLNAPLPLGLSQLGILLLFVVVAGALGYRAYGRALREPSTWGQR